MFRDVGVEGVGGQILLAAHECKAARVNDEVQESHLGTDGAVAFVGRKVFGRVHFDLDAPAVATSVMLHNTGLTSSCRANR